MPWEKEDPVVVHPPCDSCEVVLSKENVEAMRVYNRCSGDWVTSGGMEPTRITLSTIAIETALNITGIEGQKKRAIIFDRVKMAASAVAKALAAEREKKQGG